MEITSFIKGSLTAFSVLFAMVAFGQDNAPEPINNQVVSDLNQTPHMALGLTEERHIKGAFKIFDNMLKSGVELENFEIIIWGKVVENLKEGSELFRIIEDNQHPKLRVSVCQVAMDRLGVSAGDLPEGAYPVSNAFLRLFQIQANGYNVVVP